MRYLIFFLLVPFISSTQVPDSLQAPVVKEEVVQRNRAAASFVPLDSLSKKQQKPRKKIIKKFFEDYPNPKKALLTGLIIPGGGQMYNGAFWKVPLVYGAYGTVITLIVDNTRQFNFYQEQFVLWTQIGEQNREDVLDPYIFQEFTSASQVEILRDEFRRNREYSWFALFGVTLLSVADAFVDCHLKGFDVDDDISFEFKPAIINTPGWGNSAGLGFSIPIR